MARRAHTLHDVVVQSTERKAGRAQCVERPPLVIVSTLEPHAILGALYTRRRHACAHAINLTQVAKDVVGHELSRDSPFHRTIEQGGGVQRARAEPYTPGAIRRTGGMHRNVTASWRETRNGLVDEHKLLGTLRFEATPLGFRPDRLPRPEQPGLPPALGNIGVRIEAANESVEVQRACASKVLLTACRNHPAPIRAQSAMPEIRARIRVASVVIDKLTARRPSDHEDPSICR